MAAIDVRRLRPSDLCRLLNSAGEVLNERQLHRHRTRAGFRIGDATHLDLFRYVAWLVEVRHTPRPETDGDPYGYCNIYRTLKAGSGQAAHINRFFCVPTAHYLGVTPQDIIDYDLEDATHPLEEQDIKRAKDALRNDPFIRHHKEWQAALNQMLQMGVRIEQQAFAKHGLNFVLEVYLPEKLKNGKFLP